MTEGCNYIAQNILEQKIEILWFAKIPSGTKYNYSNVQIDQFSNLKSKWIDD